MIAVIRTFHESYSWKKLLALCAVAFIVRALVFYTYVQHEERYCQADSADYHWCSLFLALGHGMVRPDNQQPIFWRTPLYPWYLSCFYDEYGITSSHFSDNAAAQKAALWIQIVLSSCVPLLMFYLALLLTQLVSLSWIAAWISVFHVGFVLASTFLLTEALSLPFFMLFLFFFYKSFPFWTESHPQDINVYNVVTSAFFLALYTWIRPNGQFLAVVALVILLCGQLNWRKKLLQGALLFACVFWALLAPWYIRNHSLSGHWFYCPMFGPYIHAFCAPRALSQATGKPLEECLKVLGGALHSKLAEAEKTKQRYGGTATPRELLALEVAMPILKYYPWYVAVDWVREVCNASFDMYANQLVRFANGMYKVDPPIEYITVKFKDALYAQPMHWFMRLIIWLDFFFTLFVWIGLLAGSVLFILMPLCGLFVTKCARDMFPLWLKTGMMVGGLLIMTGGYGYARLRLPVEPLMIIVTLTFWYWAFNSGIEMRQYDKVSKTKKRGAA